jgi:UDP-N-acetylglucosamine--dolichyl-phosphate N-acetylglucosaminephosphotransferase
MKVMKKKKITGIDVHKLSRPVVPEMGGIAIFIGIFVSSLAYYMPSMNSLSKGYDLIKDSTFDIRVTVFLFSITLAFLIGVYDDFKPLNAAAKPVLLIIASIPILISDAYNSNPVLPIIGQTRLTYFYIFLVFFVVSIPANSVNMLDVFNGSTSSTGIILLISIIISVIIIDPEVEQLSFIFLIIGSLLGTLLAFHIFNRYPAKIFGGDSGSLTIGAAYGLLACLGQIEIIVVIALLPQIQNSFSILASVKGLRERRQMSRPTKLREDGLLETTAAPEAPVTLTRLILGALGPLSEKNIVRVFGLLSILSGILAILSAFLIRVV